MEIDSIEIIIGIAVTFFTFFVSRYLRDIANRAGEISRILNTDYEDFSNIVHFHDETSLLILEKILDLRRTVLYKLGDNPVSKKELETIQKYKEIYNDYRAWKQNSSYPNSPFNRLQIATSVLKEAGLLPSRKVKFLWIKMLAYHLGLYAIGNLFRFVLIKNKTSVDQAYSVLVEG